MGRRDDDDDLADARRERDAVIQREAELTREGREFRWDS